jgi:hypothetical protein
MIAHSGESLYSPYSLIMFPSSIRISSFGTFLVAVWPGALQVFGVEI